MQKLTELLTPEQQEMLKNMYMITENNEMFPIVDGNVPTRESLKVIVIDPNAGIVVLEAKDFQYCDDDDHDFKYFTEEDWDWVSRDCTPEEVVTILDEVIQEAIK